MDAWADAGTLVLALHYGAALLGPPLADILQALSLGLLAGILASLAVAIGYAIPEIGYWLAAQRVEALVKDQATADDGLRWRFLGAFQHSSRLRRLAEQFLETLRLDRAPVGQRRTDAGVVRLRSSPSDTFYDGIAAGRPVAAVAFNRFPTVMMGLGVLGLIAGVATMLLRNQFGGGADGARLGHILDAVALSATFAVGCGVVGLFASFLRWPLLRAGRQFHLRLQRAVDDLSERLVAAEALRNSQPGLAPEIMARVERLLEADRIERSAEQERQTAILTSVVDRVDELVHAARERGGSGDVGGPILRQVAIDVASLQNKLDELLAQPTAAPTEVAAPALHEALSELGSIAQALRETVGELAALFEKASASVSGEPALQREAQSRQSAAAHPIIVELNQLMGESEDIAQRPPPLREGR